MLNKTEAAEYLGCTTRTLERYIKDKKIGATYQQSKFGEIAIFDPQELEDFKLGKTASRTTRIVPATPYEQAEFIEESTATDQGQIVPTPSKNELATKPPEPLPFGLSTLMAPVQAGFRGIAEAIENLGNKRTINELQIKYLVTLEEAQIITGLSRDILQDAIKNGELPSKIMGKSYRIKQEDLKRYIDELEF